MGPFNCGELDARPVFEIIEWKISGGFYVKATLANAEPENITGFATKNDALKCGCDTTQRLGCIRGGLERKRPPVEAALSNAFKI